MPGRVAGRTRPPVAQRGPCYTCNILGQYSAPSVAAISAMPTMCIHHPRVGPPPAGRPVATPRCPHTGTGAPWVHEKNPGARRPHPRHANIHAPRSCLKTPEFTWLPDLPTSPISHHADARPCHPRPFPSPHTRPPAPAGPAKFTLCSARNDGTGVVLRGPSSSIAGDAR